MLGSKIDALIKAGWRVVETDFSESMFQEWRKRAFDCVVALCGKCHPYADYFRSGVKVARKSSVLTGVGLLTAARSCEGKAGTVEEGDDQGQPTVRQTEDP